MKDLKGECAYCHQEIAGSKAEKHFSDCPERLAVIKKRADVKNIPTEVLYHIRAQDASNGQFWLDMEMRGSATLKDLDHYLRAIWLECCGHMSQFSSGSRQRESISKKYRADDVLRTGSKLTHIYDFGTSSETLIKVVGMREGKAVTSRPISLMARNRMPESTCADCIKPATQLCMECFIDEEAWRTFCDKHMRTHPHDDYGGPVSLVNSPRLGLCGYDGPAEPPY